MRNTAIIGNAAGGIPGCREKHGNNKERRKRPPRMPRETRQKQRTPQAAYLDAVKNTAIIRKGFDDYGKG